MKKADPKYTITKLGRILDKRTDMYLDVIEFSRSENDRKTAHVPPSITHDRMALGKRLRDHGAIIDSDTWTEDHRVIARAPYKNEWVYEAQLGWSDNGKYFTLQSGAIGEDCSHILGVNIADNVGKLSRRGKWKDWSATAGMLAKRSSLFMCTVCMAFAAPLLSVAKMESFGFCTFGTTRSGKTRGGTLLPASVIGIGVLQKLLSFNQTDVAIEERLIEFNDCLIPMDDLQVVPENERFSRIQRIAYLLAQGNAKGRAKSFTRVHGGGGQWRCILLTSNEESIQALARKSRLERQGGETVRLIDLPALDEDAEHLFDRWDPIEAASLSWRDETIRQILEACEKNHGAAFHAYIKSLISMGEERIESYISQRVAYFIDRVCAPGDSALSRDVARKFALLYAGGRLGIRFQILPWDRAELLNALTKCYARARALLPDNGDLLRTGLALLAEKLATLPVVTGDNIEKFTTKYCEKIEGVRFNDSHRHLLKREVFHSIFASEPQKETVLRFLLQNGYVTKRIPKKSSDAVEAKGQHTWPDDERRRSLEITWPPRDSA